VAVLGAALFCILVLTAVVSSLFLPWWPPVGDCSGRPLFTDQKVAANTDFTARIVFVGPRTFHGFSLWSIARVGQRFAGSASWVPNLVILRGDFRASAWYLVEGKRSEGVITRFLPIVEPLSCGHTDRLDRATVALRVLHDGPPKSGVRIIGRAYERLANASSVSGVKIKIKGPSGTTFSITDGQGIFDVSGLPPGRYTVELAMEGWHPIYACDLWDGEVQDLYMELP
jgi:hypothetical protein